MNKILRNMRRTPYQTAAAMLVLYFTLFLMGILIVSISFLYGLLNYVETRPQVTVYFQSTTTEKEIMALKGELEKTGKTESIKYISKDEAYNIYKEMTKDNPLLLEMTSANILPASLEIYAKKPEFLPQLAELLKNKQGVDEVQFQKIIVDRLLALTGAVKNAALFLFAFLATMAVIVIAATSSFKIALRKDEIEILQLLGASNFFIVKPYLGEGMFMGIVSSLLATATLFVLMIVVSPTIHGYLRGIPNINYIITNNLSLQVWPFNVVFFAVTFALITVFGVIIGLIANFLASRKYLS